MPFPKPPFHSGHQTNEALSHETVRKYHRHNPPTPLEKHRINPPTPQFNSWGSDVQYTTRKKRDLDRIFPNQITRKETIKEMFGNVQKPPRYKINTNNNNVGLSKTTAGKSSFGRGGSNIIRSTI